MGERVARTLRDVIEYCDNQRLKEIFKQRVDEAEKLLDGLFKLKDCVTLPYFTPHDASHCKALENYLNQIIWGTEGQPVTLREHDFVPTPEEAMYLLSAACLHDIGMMFGIFHGEKPGELAGDTPRVIRLRDEHEIRTLKYIHDEWRLHAWDDEHEKALLSELCKYHRRHHPINTFDPAQITSKYDGKPVRLVVLAALLRLADACHEDQSRAPGRLMELYKSLGMPQEAAKYWERAKLITGVHFDHTNRRISLTGYCPPKFDFGLGEFDLREIIDIVREDIEEELRSVQPILLRYPNVYFGEVIAEISGSSAVDGENQYLAVWPYLLEKPGGSTEAAAALAQMLLFAVKDGQKNGNLGTAWQGSTLFPVMNKTQESRPFDFMIRNLCQGVRGILMKCPSDEAKCADALTEYLQGFLNGINESCRKIAERAPALIGPNDVLVVYGYCRDIAMFLETLKTKAKCNNTLYIVDYPQPVGKIQLGPSETKRMATFAGKLEFNEFRFLWLGALPQALRELTGKRPCKVLLGTHGVLKSKSLLCKVGSYMIANTAKQFGAQVIAFTEETKFLINGESDEEVASPERLFSSDKMCKRHPTMIDTLCLMPEIDLVPKELVDLVLAEKGAFPPDAVPIPAEQPTNGLVSEKKESNPA
jgi:translation initiation factor 2B subunit (eIF-2B alpha/beta/delta family)